MSKPKFTVTETATGAWYVEGIDARGRKGETFLYSPSWDGYVQSQRDARANAIFDAEVSAFYAPITKAEKRASKAAAKPGKDWTLIVVQTPKEGREGRAWSLDPDGVILRVLAERPSKVRWNKKGTILFVVA